SVPAPAAMASRAPVAKRTSAVDVEAGWIEAARTALDTGRARVALSLLDGYGHDFPNGARASDAAVLRVEAMLAAGDRAGAALFADRVAGTLPDSHMRKIRSLLTSMPIER